MDNRSLVTIAIPVYNVEKYVGRCLESVLNQTYGNIEVIIVNDSTPDNSIAVIEEMLASSPSKAGKVRIINHPKNSGLAVARNTGVESASGEYIMHVDSDDCIETDAVEKAMARLQESGADAVMFGMRHVFPDCSQIEHVTVPHEHEEYIRQLICRRNNVCICSGLYKRSLYVDNGISVTPGLNMGEDYSTKPRLLYHAKKVVALDEPLYNYYHSNLESYTRTFSLKHVNDVVKALEVLNEFFNSVPDSDSYRQALERAMVSSKVLLIKGWAAAEGEDSLLDVINGIGTDGFPCSKFEKMLLSMSRRKCKFLLRLIVRNGLKIKQLSRKINNGRAE